MKGRTRGVKVYAPRRRVSAAEERGWKVYHEATELYYSRRFDEAARGFQETLEILPNDEAATRFLQYCRKYAKTAPSAEGWRR